MFKHIISGIPMKRMKTHHSEMERVLSQNPLLPAVPFQVLPRPFSFWLQLQLSGSKPHSSVVSFLFREVTLSVLEAVPKVWTGHDGAEEHALLQM